MFLRWGVVSTMPNSQAGGPPLVGCPRLLIQNIRTYPPYWGPFLHPPPEDATCHGDRDPTCIRILTLILLKWRIGWALNNTSNWQMGFNSAFKRLNIRSSVLKHSLDVTGFNMNSSFIRICLQCQIMNSAHRLYCEHLILIEVFTKELSCYCSL
jgi:hypothetical protein